MKALIVEDDSTSRSYLKCTLETQHYKTKIAEDGLTGLQIFKKWQPDIVLTDIEMPKMDGLELLEEIRKLNTGSIVILITAYGCEEYAIRALQSRANNYLKKPVRLAELLPLLEKYTPIIESINVTQKEFSAIIKPELHRIIDNRIKMVPKIVAEMLLETGKAFDKESRLDVRLGLIEVLMNSIEHGNLGITHKEKFEALKVGRLESLHKERLSIPKFRDRRVIIDFKPDEASCEWIVTDEGKGFDWEKSLQRAESADILELNSRGLIIIQNHFDEVEYCGSGNQIRVKKYI